MAKPLPPSRHPVGSLARALDYQNDNVVDKYLERIEMSQPEAAAIFEETKKWLWLTSREDRPELPITQELLILDEMWHTFLLFTVDYKDYCLDRLGQFVHHVPTPKSVKDQRERERAANPDAFHVGSREILEGEFEFIADQLGTDTLYRWFVEYPRRYGPEFFERASRPPQSMLHPVLIAHLDRVAEQFGTDAANEHDSSEE